ncbi:chloride channel protein [Solitalea longa]|uniref:Chloride channel protein n=1 Tax=Solitalea longa TaxID=2079460 RepID=A0A2S5AAA4_9SPHI|nr:chloride channel protein [Solitalea longa]POY39312.1 chloride channel protein [Solitalea longa]
MERIIPIAPSLSLDDNIAVSTTNPIVNKRLFYLSMQVIANAIIIGVVAKILVALINLFTNLSFYGTFSFHESSPAANSLGLFVIIIPCIGGLVVGLMARWGSPAIRGHGIPEAMEQVLTNESKIKPIITLLKPLSAAISIGTGGPFGAEGPIISTGGAFGSFVGQIMHITPNERKIVLTAGATAGMAAIFGTPIAAVLLAIELLLFEFSPRSIIPVALACATGAAMHLLLFGKEAVFAMPNIPEPGSMALVWYVLLGAIIGVVSAGISKSIYLIEDLFEKLPIHWLWWPAIGAIAVGVTGYFAPYTLGVGYSNISHLLSGNLPLKLVLGLCFLKFISWSISLGSGTSGGTLAPLLTIGGATGILLGLIVQKLFPQSEINLPTCALIGMASMFAGAARALLTSIVFAFETTMQPHGLLPLLGACTAAYFVSFFMMKTSIMTEKIQRRGVHTPNAYEPDILQGLLVKNVMAAKVNTIKLSATIAELNAWVLGVNYKYSEIIVVDQDDRFAGILTLPTIHKHSLKDNDQIHELVRNHSHFVLEASSLSKAIACLDKQGSQILPVLNHQREVVSFITSTSILSYYNNHRSKNEQYQRTISLKRKSFNMYLKGKKMFN